MAVGFPVSFPSSPHPRWVLYLILTLAFAPSRLTHAQTASTGALAGVVFDPSGYVVPGVILHLDNVASGESRSATSDQDGRFSFLFLPPGAYSLQAGSAHLAPLTMGEINVSVTESQRVEVHLRLAPVIEEIQVSSEGPITQTDSSALGRVVDQTALTSLPLVTRSFAQIAGLSPGVNASVFNAGELGLGGIALS
jgi:hypothetical protein